MKNNLNKRRCLLLILILIFTGRVNVIKAAAIYTPLNSDSLKISKPDSTIVLKYKAQRIFTQVISLTETSADGSTIKDPSHPIVQKGQGFEVIGLSARGGLIVKLWVWSLKSSGQTPPKNQPKNLLESDNKAVLNEDSAKKMEIIVKRNAYNFIKYANQAYAPESISAPFDNRRFFTIAKDTVDQFSTIYQKTQTWDINFGILTMPFKLRFNSFAFTSNTGLGTAVYFQKKSRENWTWGFAGGFSLSSVTLDAASTFIHADGTAGSTTTAITTSTTRPAFTPSVSFVLSYKTINFMVGSGADFISKPNGIATATNPEAGWIYNGKPWIGIGFGINIFGNNISPQHAPSTAGQTTP
ncbi:MAG: hypothetical protein ACXVAY_01110 [Mucilaginibacter sp.]